MTEITRGIGRGYGINMDSIGYLRGKKIPVSIGVSRFGPEQIRSVVYGNGVVRFCGRAYQRYLPIAQNFIRNGWQRWHGVESECQRGSACVSGNVRFACDNRM